MSKHSVKSFKRVLALTLTPFMFSTCMPWSQALTASANEVVVSDYDGLKEALEEGGSIKLDDDISFDTSLYAKENASIDLAGYTLEYTGTSEAMDVYAAKVSFSDSSEEGIGTFTSSGTLIAATDAFVTLSGGTYTANDTGIYAYQSSVTFNGGKLTAKYDAISADYFNRHYYFLESEKQTNIYTKQQKKCVPVTRNLLSIIWKLPYPGNCNRNDFL